MSTEFPDGWLENGDVLELRFPEYSKEFEFGGWPLSEWLLIQGWFKTRYGPAALPSDVQKVHDSWPGPWPGINKEKNAAIRISITAN